MIRSLRWRLVAFMVLIIAAVVAAAGVFSTLRITRELDEFMIQQRRAGHVAALAVLRAGGPDALRRAFESANAPIVVVDDAKKVVARYPPELASFDIRLQKDG